MLAQIYLDQQLYTAAFGMLEVAARSADPRALNMLGRAYERGWGVVRNIPSAINYFNMAADLGYGWAFFNLADLHMAGRDIPQDTAKAKALYIRAAQAGVSKALTMLGLLLEDTQPPCPTTTATARQYYQAAADANDCWGFLNLARLLLQDGDHAAATASFQPVLQTGFKDCFLAMKALLPHLPEPQRSHLLCQTEARLRP